MFCDSCFRFFFFFKQKTAYEMRISDWSSDVCSSDLQRKEAEERASLLAATDPLTGFLNRRSIAEAGIALLERAASKHKSVALLMLDLDNFKNVNDVHGHAAGDLVLQTAAKRIESLLPPSALTARLGGDEFACAFKIGRAQV